MLLFPFLPLCSLRAQFRLRAQTTKIKTKLTLFLNFRLKSQVTPKLIHVKARWNYSPQSWSKIQTCWSLSVQRVGLGRVSKSLKLYFCEGRLEAFESNRGLLCCEVTELWCKWEKKPSSSLMKQKQTQKPQSTACKTLRTRAWCEKKWAFQSKLDIRKLCAIQRPKTLECKHFFLREMLHLPD